MSKIINHKTGRLVKVDGVVGARVREFMRSNPREYVKALEDKGMSPDQVENQFLRAGVNPGVRNVEDVPVVARAPRRLRDPAAPAAPAMRRADPEDLMNLVEDRGKQIETLIARARAGEIPEHEVAPLIQDLLAQNKETFAQLAAIEAARGGQDPAARLMEKQGELTEPKDLMDLVKVRSDQIQTLLARVKAGEITHAQARPLINDLLAQNQETLAQHKRTLVGRLGGAGGGGGGGAVGGPETAEERRARIERQEVLVDPEAALTTAPLPIGGGTSVRDVQARARADARAAAMAARETAPRPPTPRPPAPTVGEAIEAAGAAAAPAAPPAHPRLRGAAPAPPPEPAAEPEAAPAGADADADADADAPEPAVRHSDIPEVVQGPVEHAAAAPEPERPADVVAAPPTEGKEIGASEDAAIKKLQKSETVLGNREDLNLLGKDSPEELREHGVLYRSLIDELFTSHSYIRLENQLKDRAELRAMLQSDNKVDLYNAAERIVLDYRDHIGIEKPRYGIDADVNILTHQVKELYTIAQHVLNNLGRQDKSTVLNQFNRVGVIVSASSMGLSLESLMEWARTAAQYSGTGGTAPTVQVDRRKKHAVGKIPHNLVEEDKELERPAEITAGEAVSTNQPLDIEIAQQKKSLRDDRVQAAIGTAVSRSVARSVARDGGMQAAISKARSHRKITEAPRVAVTGQERPSIVEVHLPISRVKTRNVRKLI